MLIKPSTLEVATESWSVEEEYTVCFFFNISSTANADFILFYFHIKFMFYLSYKLDDLVFSVLVWEILLNNVQNF